MGNHDRKGKGKGESSSSRYHSPDDGGEGSSRHHGRQRSGDEEILYEGRHRSSRTEESSASNATERTAPLNPSATSFYPEQSNYTGSTYGQQSQYGTSSSSSWRPQASPYNPPTERPVDYDASQRQYNLPGTLDYVQTSFAYPSPYATQQPAEQERDDYYARGLRSDGRPRTPPDL